MDWEEDAAVTTVWHKYCSAAVLLTLTKHGKSRFSRQHCPSSTIKWLDFTAEGSVLFDISDLHFGPKMSDKRL